MAEGQQVDLNDAMGRSPWIPRSVVVVSVVAAIVACVALLPHLRDLSGDPGCSPGEKQVGLKIKDFDARKGIRPEQLDKHGNVRGVTITPSECAVQTWSVVGDIAFAVAIAGPVWFGTQAIIRRRRAQRRSSGSR